MRKHYYHYEGNSTAVSIFIIVASLALSFGILALWGWLFTAVWNNLLPMLWSAAPVMNFWLGLGIVVILRILFKPLIKTNKD